MTIGAVRALTAGKIRSVGVSARKAESMLAFANGTSEAKLVAADVVVLQYPVFWYGMPALMQRWMEDVLAHGFSHGSSGKALVGKRLVVSMTIGAPEEAYGEGAAVRIADLLKPAKGACALTGMEFAGCECTCGVSCASRADDAAREAIAEKGRQQAIRIAKLIEEL